MAFARVQGGSNQDWSGGSVTTVTATVSAIGSGNLVSGYVTAGGNMTDLQVKDGSGNSCTMGTAVYDATNNQTAQSFYKANITNSPTTFVLSRVSAGSMPYAAIVLDEFSGVATSSPLTGTPAQQAQASPGTGTDAITSGTTTPGANGALIYGWTQNDGGSTLASAGTGYTSATSNATIAGRTEYLTQGTAAAKAATFTVAANEAHITGVMAFLPAAGGAGSVFADSDIRWSQLASIQASGDMRWSMLNSAQADPDLRWSMLNSAQADPDLRWSMLKAVQADIDARWAVLGIEQTISWDASDDPGVTGYAYGWGLVSHAGGIAADYTNIVNADSALGGTLTNLVAGSTYYFGVSAYGSYGDTSTWSLVDEQSFVAGQTSVSADIELRWSSLASAQKDIDARWSMLASALADNDARWSLLGSAQTDADIRWGMLSAAHADVDSRWQMAGTVTADADIRWAMMGSAQNDADIRWGLFGSASQDLDARWSVIGFAQADADLQWGLLSDALTAQAYVDLRWAIGGVTILGRRRTSTNERHPRRAPVTQ